MHVKEVQNIYFSPLDINILVSFIYWKVNLKHFILTPIVKLGSAFPFLKCIPWQFFAWILFCYHHECLNYSLWIGERGKQEERFLYKYNWICSFTYFFNLHSFSFLQVILLPILDLLAVLGSPSFSLLSYVTLSIVIWTHIFHFVLKVFSVWAGLSICLKSIHWYICMRVSKKSA